MQHIWGCHLNVFAPLLLMHWKHLLFFFHKLWRILFIKKGATKAAEYKNKELVNIEKFQFK